MSTFITTSSIDHSDVHQKTQRIIYDNTKTNHYFINRILVNTHHSLSPSVSIDTLALRNITLHPGHHLYRYLVDNNINSHYSWIGRPVQAHKKLICRKAKRATADLNIRIKSSRRGASNGAGKNFISSFLESYS